MSDLGGRLASFFVAPPAPAPAFGPPSGGRLPAPSAELSPAVPPVRVERRQAAIAVVGGEAAAGFAVDLTAALAARARRRSAVIAVWGTGAPAPPRGQVTRAAAHTLSALTGVGGAMAGGRVVVVSLPDDVPAALDVWSSAHALQAQTDPVVLALCGPRSSGFDPLLAAQDRIVLALTPGHPDGLATTAAGSLQRSAPRASVQPVTLPAAGPLPRPLRHRAAIRAVLGELS